LIQLADGGAQGGHGNDPPGRAAELKHAKAAPLV
jgi:hypothetical protein